ncbi:MAG: hypothetical protein AAEJ65_09425, partial [Planctomycetota bacterium]
AMIAIVLVCGGCAHVPDVDRHFKLHNAYETVRYFRYAIDAGQYGAAYRCLSPESQQQISKLAFEAMLRFVDVPELGGIGLRNLFVDSTVDSHVEVVSSGQPQKWVTLIWSSDDRFIEYSLLLAPSPSNQWQIDLLSTRGVDLQGAS